MMASRHLFLLALVALVWNSPVSDAWNENWRQGCNWPGCENHLDGVGRGGSWGGSIKSGWGGSGGRGWGGSGSGGLGGSGGGVWGGSGGGGWGGSGGGGWGGSGGGGWGGSGNGVWGGSGGGGGWGGSGGGGWGGAGQWNDNDDWKTGNDWNSNNNNKWSTNWGHNDDWGSNNNNWGSSVNHKNDWWSKPVDCNKCWGGTDRFDWRDYKKDFETAEDFDHDILTCSVRRNGKMSLTATLRKNEGHHAQKSDVRMVVTLSTGPITGSLYLMLAEGPRYEDLCNTDTVGSIIPRIKHKNIPWVSNNCGPHNNCADQSELLRHSLHRFNFHKNDKLRVTLTDLPFTKLSSFGGRGLALCTQIVLSKSSLRYECVGEIPICCKLGYDDVDATERPFWYQHPNEIGHK